MQSHGDGARSGVRLHSLQADEERRERELMNLKMEVAHLRERLHMRVGGETNAIELEDENFTLKRSLLETQRALVEHQDALREMDSKYAKAMLNLVKLDQAWKASTESLKHAQEQARDAEARALELEHDLDVYQQDRSVELAAADARLQQRDEQIAALEHDCTRIAQELELEREERERLELHVRELQGHLAAVKSSSRSKSDTTVSQQDYAALQRAFQDAQEQCATLRGETNALRDESAALKTQVADAKAAVEATTSRLLQLKEDYATAQVRLASATQSVETHKHDGAFLASEIDRIQTELRKRDDRLLQLEHETERQRAQLSDQRKQLESADDAVAGRIERAVRARESEWRARETELEQLARDAQTQVHRLEQLQSDVVALVRDGTEQETNDNSSSRSDRLAPDEVLALVKRHVRRSRVAAASLEKATAQIERLERDVAHQSALAVENDALRTECERVKKVMERMAQRKSSSSRTDGSRTPTKAAPKRPWEERIEFLKARAEPLRAKRKLDASHDESESSRGVARSRTSSWVAGGVLTQLGRGTDAPLAPVAPIASSAPTTPVATPKTARSSSALSASASSSSAAADSRDSNGDESAPSSTKVKLKRVFVQSRYLNNVTGRRTDL